MSEYADKLQEWVDSVKMCEAAGIEPCYNFNDGSLVTGTPAMGILIDFHRSYRFPIAVVEGKPVFVGDELYNSLGEKFIVTRLCNGGTALESKFPASNGCNCETLKSCSWNLPKPKTVMVEMLVKDAMYMRTLGIYGYRGRVAASCRKALEEIK